MATARAPRTIWDFWAPRYERLWVQVLSLEPTRRHVLRRLERECPQARRFLDLGCGTGQLAGEIAARFPQATVLAIDPCEAMIRCASAQRCHPRIRYQVGEVDSVSPGSTFDVITSTHSLPYVRDARRVLEAARALLVPGGRVVVVHANTQNAWDWLVLQGVEWTTTRARYRSTAALAAALAEAGLRPTCIEPVATRWLVPSIHLVEAVR